MIKNYYYLITGLLSILFAVTHAWNGQANFWPDIKAADFNAITETTVFYIWHIITAENLIFGLAFLIMSAYKDQSSVKSAAWIIVVIIIVRWMVIFGSTLLKNRSGVTDTLTDSIAIVIYVVLIIVGIRKRQQAKT